MIKSRSPRGKSKIPAALFWFARKDKRFVAARSHAYSQNDNNDFMYNKVMIIDDRIVVTGSYNFSENAESNDKNMLILESSMAAAAYTKYFELLFEQYQKHDEQVVALSILCRAVARSPEVQPLTGDRSIREKDFGRIQIDRVLEMEKWAESIKTVQDEHIKLAIIAPNNHYAGFGPGSANVFRNMLGLPEAKWEDRGTFRPMQRMGTPNDVANVAEYLAGDLAAFVSGQHLLVTGGAPA